MSTQRYSDSRSFREESHRGLNDPYYQPVGSARISTIPVEYSSGNLTSNVNQQRVQERLRHQDTTVQWVTDPINGQEKFRVTINIDGFDQNEVNTRVDGNKLLVYGEHIENKNQSTTKKIIEKSYELPGDIDKISPHVTFPTLTTMQVDFPSRHSNVIYDDGRNLSKPLSNYETSIRPLPGFTQERTSSEFTSTRKLGGGSGGNTGSSGISTATGITNTGSLFDRNTSSQTYSPYEELKTGYGNARASTYTSSNVYQSNDYQKPSYRSNLDTNNGSSFNDGSLINEPKRSTFPSTSFRDDNRHVQERTYSETHRETQHQRSSPTSGVQSSRAVEHQRSGSPTFSRKLDEDRFRTNLNISHGSTTAPSSSHQVEVREYSRRVGADGLSGSSDLPLLPVNFNADAFYRSAFQPQIITNDRGQRSIEMKLDVNSYKPSEIKVSVNGNDLVVQAEHNEERPPKSSSRAFFYKQITLPSNTDLPSLASQYHPDGKLQITAKLTDPSNKIEGI